MSNPALQPPPEFWQQILTNPAVLVNYLALLLNIGILIYNYFWFKFKRGSERRYDLNFTFYELSVLKSLKDLINFSSNIRKYFNSLLVETRKACTLRQPTLPIAQKHIELLDKLIDDLRLDSLLLIKGYSPELGKKIDDLAEKFYDDSTVVFSKFNRASFTVEFEREMGNKISFLSTQYVQYIFARTKEHCPSHNL